MNTMVDYDVLIIGAGPAGLATACRLLQLSIQQKRYLRVAILEKGAEIGAHIVSGAVFDARALKSLFPDVDPRLAFAAEPLKQESFHWLITKHWQLPMPSFLLPPTLLHQYKNQYLITAGKLCRWLAKQAQALGADIYTGFAAQQLLFDQNRVCGVITNEFGRAADGHKKANFVAGMPLRAHYTLLAEGARGHLGQQVIKRYQLDAQSAQAHYALGLKELWQIKAKQHQVGRLLHGNGWPLQGRCSGGWFLYHLADEQIALGVIVDLNYRNPWLNPFAELQRFKHHPLIKSFIEGGQRLSYGARVLNKSGPEAMPAMVFAGGALLGCNAGTLNVARLQGLHTAMQHGIIAAETLMASSQSEFTHGKALDKLPIYWQQSWLARELEEGRGFGAAVHRFGTNLGGLWHLCNQRIIRLPILTDPCADADTLRLATRAKQYHYKAPDQKISFDLTSSLALANLTYQSDQPNHLILHDSTFAVAENWYRYAEPAQRYCPAGVYEVMLECAQPQLITHPSNCLHCKTCTIKDPAHNISWQAPEGGNGPQYGEL